jgi:hypothetical protein
VRLLDALGGVFLRRELPIKLSDPLLSRRNPRIDLALDLALDESLEDFLCTGGTGQ